MRRYEAEREWKRLTGSRKPSQPQSKCYRFPYSTGLIRRGQRVIEATTVRKRMGEMLAEIAARRNLEAHYPNLARAA